MKGIVTSRDTLSVCPFEISMIFYSQLTITTHICWNVTLGPIVLFVLGIHQK